MMTLSFLVNTRDIGVISKSATGVKVYRWILHPTSDYKDKGEVRLPLIRGSVENLTGRDHYCIPGALPKSIQNAFGEAQETSSDAEEESAESVEEEESGSESESSEQGGGGERDAGLNDVEMAEGVPSSEMGDYSGFVQSRAPSPRVSSRPPSATASHPPPQPPSTQAFSHTIPLTQSSHHTQPIPSPQPQPGFADYQAYFDQKFDALFAGQQSILASLESMRIHQEQQFEIIHDTQQELYRDHTALLCRSMDMESKVNEMWGYLHEWPRYDDGNWSPWPEPGQPRRQAARDDNNEAGWQPGFDASNVAGPSGAYDDANVDQGQIWGENSDDSFHPPDDYF